LVKGRDFAFEKINPISGQAADCMAVGDWIWAIFWVRF
jgi:hypothetical protein